MGDYLVTAGGLRRHNGTFVRLETGRVISDDEFDIDEVRASGIAVVPYDALIMAPVLDAWGRQPNDPSTEDRLRALLSVAQAFGARVLREHREIWISPDGSDDASGTQADPMSVDQSIREYNAYDMVAENGSLTVHMRSGVYPVTVRFEAVIRRGPVCWIGDGGGVAGDDGFEVLATGTAQAGTGAAAIVTTGGLTKNEYIGKTLEMTSGNALGRRRSIAANYDGTDPTTPDQILPATDFRYAPAPGDTYRIVEPKVRLRFPSVSGEDATDPRNQYQIRGFGAEGGMAPNYNANPQFAPRNSLTFVNMRWESDGAELVAYWQIIGEQVLFHGVEIDRAGNGFMLGTSAPGTTILSGTDGRGFSVATGRKAIAATVVDLGLAPDRFAWAGWGMTAIGAFSMSAGTFQGIACGRDGGGFGFVQDATAFVYGGGIDAGSAAALTLTQGARGQISGHDAVRLKLFSSGTLGGIYLAACSMNLLNIDLEQDGGACGIAVEGDGSGQGARPASVSLQDVHVIAGSSVPANAISLSGRAFAGWDAGSFTATGFGAGTQCAVRSGGSDGTVESQTDIASIGIATPFPTDVADRAFGLFMVLS